MIHIECRRENRPQRNGVYQNKLVIDEWTEVLKTAIFLQNAHDRTHHRSSKTNNEKTYTRIKPTSFILFRTCYRSPKQWFWHQRSALLRSPLFNHRRKRLSQQSPTFSLNIHDIYHFQSLTTWVLATDMGSHRNKPWLIIMPTFFRETFAGKVVERPKLPLVWWFWRWTEVSLIEFDRSKHCKMLEKLIFSR